MKRTSPRPCLPSGTKRPRPCYRNPFLLQQQGKGLQDHTEDVAYGDLNLGMPEYRSLHFIREEEKEKEKEEGDSGENSGPGGEASGSGESTDGAPEAPEKVTYEYYSDYGYYKNADAGLASERTENDEAKVPDDNKIWDAGNLGADGQIGDAWWDYTRHVWPDQGEDLENAY